LEKITYVLGHKNPDTDSVVSSYAFALLQNKLGKTEYVAGRAGKLSPQTEFIFRKFDVKPPVFISDLTPEVSYYMDENVFSVNENQTLQFAANVMQKNSYQYLVLTDDQNKFKSLLNYSSFARNLINSLNTEHHIKVKTNHKLLQMTLCAIGTGSQIHKCVKGTGSQIHKCVKGTGSQIHTESNNEAFVEGTIILGATDISSFKKTVSSRKEQNLIVITGDREDIIRFAIESNVYCVIISGGHSVSEELINLAVKNDVCILISPFDTASTSMLTSHAVPLSEISEEKAEVLNVHDSISKARNVFRRNPGCILPVINEAGTFAGILSENDLNRDPKISVSLVDHNELSQAVDGIENYPVREIIDHHRIGLAPTKYPVTFINRVVGSTATIIAGLFEENKIQIDVKVAGLLLGGILSDTLILKSATVTETDIDVAKKLASIAGLNIEEYGNEIIEAGSRIKDRKADDLILQDLKEYSEADISFTVSQIEVHSFNLLLKRKNEFLEELNKIRMQKNVCFTSLLVTDISNLNSILLVSGDSAVHGIMEFPLIENDVYLLKHIVSRKKQLIPLLSELIQHL